VAVIIEEDQSERGGFALIDLGRKVNGPLRFSFRRLDAEPRNLGTSGWQSETTWLSPDRIVRSDPTTIVRFGPEVVDQISELVLIEIVLDGFGIVETANWPFLMKSSRSLASVRIQAPKPSSVGVTRRSIAATREVVPEPTLVSTRSVHNKPQTRLPEHHLGAAPPRAGAPVVDKPGKPQEIPASPIDVPVAEESLESEFRAVLAVDRTIENWEKDILESGFKTILAVDRAVEKKQQDGTNRSAAFNPPLAGVLFRLRERLSAVFLLPVAVVIIVVIIFLYAFLSKNQPPSTIDVQLAPKPPPAASPSAPPAPWTSRSPIIVLPNIPR
jgi:hypothetical protein